jgi:hypothetical protein
MRATVPIREALADSQLLGGALAGDSWAAWRTLLIAAMGGALTEPERAIFKSLTQREREPQARVEELAIVAGRRGGKSRALSTLACYLASLVDYSTVLAPGERGVCLMLAPDQRQAKIDLDYCTAAFEQSPVLKQLIANRTADTLELTNGISCEVRAASRRNLRGLSCVAILLDECAFLYTDEFSANADVEILNSVRPGLATTGGPTIICSSPYSRRGVLWSVYKEHFGSKGDASILVAQAPSRVLNPTLAQSVVDRAIERDRSAASAEYLGLFRADIETFVPLEVVEGCIGDFLERPPDEKHRYFAFCDPSGGSSDSFTLGIAHREGDRVVIDAIRETRPPFSPEAVVDDFARVLKSYRVSCVTGDRFGGEWPREQFRKRGITYKVATKVRSDLYRDFLPVLNSNRVLLPKSDRLINQLCSLERHTGASGKDRIDHRQGGHDDLANVAAGVADLVATPAQQAVWGVGLWNNSGCWRSDGKHVRPEDVVNPQSQPDSAVHVEPREVDERYFKIIRDPNLRIW